MLGLLDPKAFPRVQTICFGVIPKQTETSKQQLILDLSNPHHASINDDLGYIQLASIDIMQPE